MSEDFLQRMARTSRERVRRAREKESEAELRARALATPPPPVLTLDTFDVIAELKLRSPAAGELAAQRFGRDAQLQAYAEAGAAAVSVLTEPAEFGGSLEDLARAAALLGPRSRPVMRKDFITEPYQVFETRACGAGGILVIVAMFDHTELRALVECARECGLFVLLEAFDARDLERIAAFDAPANGPAVLAGVNCRNLRDLSVEFGRFAELAGGLPPHLPAVAESGIATREQVREVAANGYALALVGAALMTSRDPRGALAGLISAGRTAAAR